MTLLQAVIILVGVLLIGVGIYFHSKNKKADNYVIMGTLLIVVAAINPTAFFPSPPSMVENQSSVNQQKNVTKTFVHETKPLTNKPSKAMAAKTAVPSKPGKKQTTKKPANPRPQLATVEPVAKIKESTLLKETGKKSQGEPSAADYLLMGTQSWEQKNYSQAFQYVNLGLTQPSGPRVRSSLILLQGSLYEAIGNRKAAEENYQTASKIDPKYNWPYIKLGNLYTGMKQFAQAEQAYNKAVGLDPKDSWTYNNLGVLYSKQKRYAEAEQAYQTSLRLNPADAWAYNNLGVLYKDLNRYQEAEKAYNDAVSLDPNNVLAKNNLLILQKLQQSQSDAMEVGPPSH